THVWIGIEDWQPQTQITAQKSILAEKWKQQSPSKGVIFDFKAIERLRCGIEEDEVEMQRYFTACEIQPFKVVYEDFVDTYEETACQILDYLQIPVPEQLIFGERSLKKQANEQSEEWVQRYYGMKQKDDREQKRETGGR